MKRFLSIGAAAILVAALAVPAAALENLHAGIRGGLNIANVSADPDDTELADSRNGLALGGFVAFPVTPMISVQPEALFMMKGDKQEEGDVTSNVKLNYIEVPVLAKVNFMPQGTANPSLFLGPSVGFNTTAKSEVEMGTDPAEETDIKDSTKSVDFGLVFGGGLEMPVGQGGQKVGFDIRYTMGLVDINDDATDTTEFKNGTLSVMGSFSFI
jgi:hypothetical protein